MNIPSDDIATHLQLFHDLQVKETFTASDL